MDEKKTTCKVSVLCAAYNHEDYLRQTLDSFLAQKTDFPFEVLINDDASTDTTADIIREYAEKHPDIIRPFYQEENLYSRRINLYDTVFFPAARGEYIALCEGDDYWNDPEKLQLQVNWLDIHPDYSACVHNSIGCFEDQPDKVLFAQDGDRDIPFEQVIQGMSHAYHTSSILARREFILDPPDYRNVAYEQGYFTDYAVAGYPWYRFIFQSLLGAEGEEPGTDWEKMAPTDIYPVLSGASIVSQAGDRRPVFTGETTVLFDGKYLPPKHSPFTPVVVFAILLALTLLLTATGRPKPLVKAFDIALLVAQTLLGLFFTGLLLFSSASWMPGNTMPVVFNPLPVVLWALFRKKSWFRRVWVTFAVVLAAMIVATPFVPQLQWAHALLFATFLVRVIAHVIPNPSK